MAKKRQKKKGWKRCWIIIKSKDKKQIMHISPSHYKRMAEWINSQPGRMIKENAAIDTLLFEGDPVRYAFLKKPLDKPSTVI